MPGLLGILGAAGSGLALAPALRVLNWPFLALTVLLLGRGWYLELSHGGRWRSTWRRRSSVVLIASTLLATAIWALRFVGLLGLARL